MVGTVAGAVEMMKKNMEPPEEDLEPEDMPVHLGQGMDLELLAECHKCLDLLLVEKIKMTIVKPVVGCHLIDPRVQVHRLTFLEKIGGVGGALGHVSYGPTYIFYYRTDMVFPFVFNFLEKRTQHHFSLP